MIFASACWCCHQCILSAQILTTLMAAGIDSVMHLRSLSASFTSLRSPGRRSSLTVFVWSIYHASWCSEPFKDVWTTRFIAGKQFLAFKLVFYMKIQLESRRLQEQANTGTSVLSFQWGNFISNGKGGRILKPKEALVKLICNRSH